MLFSLYKIFLLSRKKYLIIAFSDVILSDIILSLCFFIIFLILIFMLKFYNVYSHVIRKSLGFARVYTERHYMPVPLKIRVAKKCYLADDVTGEKRRLWCTNEFVEYYLISGQNYHFNYCFFIKDDRSAYAGYLVGDDDAVEIVFDAEKFFYLMEHASRKNKLNFFRRAVVTDAAEATKFLALVSSSDLSVKDKNRAHTWMSQLMRHRFIG